jgi:PAS domain S-box-containing protein
MSEDFVVIADTLPLMSWRTNAEGLTNYHSPALVEFVGCNRMANWIETVHRKDRKFVSLHWEEAVAKQSRFLLEFRCRRADGTYRWIKDVGIPVKDEQGEFAGFIGFAIDIDDQKRLQRRLRRRSAENNTEVLTLLRHAITHLDSIYPANPSPEAFVMAWETADSFSDVCDRLRMDRAAVTAQAEQYVRAGVTLKEFSHNLN